VLADPARPSTGRSITYYASIYDRLPYIIADSPPITHAEVRCLVTGDARCPVTALTGVMRFRLRNQSLANVAWGVWNVSTLNGWCKILISEQQRQNQTAEMIILLIAANAVQKRQIYLGANRVRLMATEALARVASSIPGFLLVQSLYVMTQDPRMTAPPPPHRTPPCKHKGYRSPCLLST
jgi:hypothetical protein